MSKELSLKGYWTLHKPILQAGQFLNLFTLEKYQVRMWGIVNENLLSSLKGMPLDNTVTTSILVLEQDQWHGYQSVELGLNEHLVRFVTCGHNSDLWLFSYDQNMVQSITQFDGIYPTQYHPISEISIWIGVNLFSAAICDHSGALWIALQGSGALRHTNGEWQIISDQNSKLTGNLNAMFIDSNGIVWFANLHKRYVSIVTFDGFEWNEFVQLPTPKRFHQIGCILIDKDKNLWIGWRGQDISSEGIWVVDSKGTIVAKFDKKNSHLPSLDITSMVMDAHGRVWIGVGTGIAVFENGISGCWITIEPDNLDISKSRRHAVELTHRPQQELMEFIVDGPQVDEKGNIWVHSSHGIARFTESYM